MNCIGAAVCLLALAPLAAAQLTQKQRIADLESLAAIYAKNYAPYDWKKPRSTSIASTCVRGWSA